MKILRFLLLCTGSRLWSFIEFSWSNSLCVLIIVFFLQQRERTIFIYFTIFCLLKNHMWYEFITVVYLAERLLPCWAYEKNNCSRYWKICYSQGEENINNFSREEGTGTFRWDNPLFHHRLLTWSLTLFSKFVFSRKAVQVITIRVLKLEL